MAELNSAEPQPDEPMVWPYLLMAVVLVWFIVLPLFFSDEAPGPHFYVYAVMAILVILSVSDVLIKKLKGKNLFVNLELPEAKWTFFDVLSIVILWFFFFMLLLLPIFAVVGKDGEIENHQAYMLAADSVSKLIAILLLFNIIRRRHQKLAEALGLGAKGVKPNILPALVSAVLIIPMVAIIGALWSLLIQSVGFEAQDQEIVKVLREAKSPVLITAVIISSVIVAPLVEEIFFRGFIYRMLRKHLNITIAAVITGALFGAVHGALASVLPLAVFGIVMCYAYERSGKLYVPIIIHAVFNAAAVAMILFSPFEPLPPNELKDPVAVYADVSYRNWEYIVIHHSATQSGGAKSIGRYHKNVKGWDGVGYDFIIGNGKQTGDGEIEVSDRWRRQLDGAHCPEQDMNIRGISVCFVGNFDIEGATPTDSQIAAGKELVKKLSEQFNIPPERIIGHREVQGTSTKCPGDFFPVNKIRSAALKSENKP